MTYTDNFFAYKRGLDAMFESFTAAERDGVSLKPALHIIGEWFDKELSRPVQMAGDLDAADSADDPRMACLEEFCSTAWPCPPRKDFRDMVPDGLRVKDHDESQDNDNKVDEYPFPHESA